MNVGGTGGTSFYAGRDPSYAPIWMGDGGVAIRLLALVPGSVPEPGTWLTMMIGFFAAGAALRRRRADQAHAARAWQGRYQRLAGAIVSPIVDDAVA